MAYRIEYGPVQKPSPPQRSKRLRLQILTVVFLVMFVLLVRQTWPAGSQKLRQILLPGEADSAQAAFQELVDDLRDGTSITEAVTVFCQQIIDDAKSRE